MHLRRRSGTPAPIVINSGQTAGAQAEYNQEAAEKTRALNMINQYTPQGSSVFGNVKDDAGENVLVNGVEQFGVTQSYSPEQQNLFDSQNRMRQGYADFGESQLEMSKTLTQRRLITDSLAMLLR